MAPNPLVRYKSEAMLRIPTPQGRKPIATQTAAAADTTSTLNATHPAEALVDWAAAGAVPVPDAAVVAVVVGVGVAVGLLPGQ